MHNQPPELKASRGYGKRIHEVCGERNGSNYGAIVLLYQCVWKNEYALGRWRERVATIFLFL